MPRNVLKAKTDEQLAMEYALRTTSQANPPSKLYSTSDIFNELTLRLGTIKTRGLIDVCRNTLDLMG